MKRKIFSILFAVVLVLSFSLVTAVPAAAEPGEVPKGSYSYSWTTSIMDCTDFDFTVGMGWTGVGRPGVPNVYYFFHPDEIPLGGWTEPIGGAWLFENIDFDESAEGQTFSVTSVTDDPDFAGFASLLTNGTDEDIWFGYIGDRDNIASAGGQKGVLESLVFSGTDVGTDFPGYVIQSVSLTFNQIYLDPENVNKLVLDFTLDIYAAPLTEVWVDDDFTDATEGWGITHFAIIQDGIEAVAEDGTINVAAGTYEEHISIDKSDLSLVGEDKETTIIDARQDSSWTYPKPGILINGVSSVTVSGFTIQDAAIDENGDPFTPDYGWGPQAKTAILIYATAIDHIIENNILINNYWGVFVCAEGSATTECRNNRIANNIIRDGEQDGVYLYTDGVVPVENTEIVNNQIYNRYDTYASGVEFWAWPETEPKNLAITGTVIRDNDITNCTYGFRIRDSVEDVTGTLVNSNNFVGSTTYGVYNGVASTVDATNNWWGHASGPIPPGTYESYGDKVSDNVDYEPWLLKEVIPGIEPTTYDKTLALKDGWTLISTGKALSSNLAWVGATLSYKYAPTTRFEQLEEADLSTLGPLDTIYVKTDDGGGIGLSYAEAGPTVYSKELEAGWNLIGIPSISGNVTTGAILSPLRYVTVGTQQGVGLATLVSQGDYNQFSDSFYLATLTDADWDALVPLDPFDGYWAYMNAAKTFEVIPD